MTGALYRDRLPTRPIPPERPAAAPPSPSARFGSMAGRDTGMERAKRRASDASSTCSMTFFGESRAVTLRASGPVLMNQLYRSSPEVSPSGCRKKIIALLEPGSAASTFQRVPSGASKLRIS